jgi:hypothetical protein
MTKVDMTIYGMIVKGYKILLAAYAKVAQKELFYFNDKQIKSLIEYSENLVAISDYFVTVFNKKNITN